MVSASVRIRLPFTKTSPSPLSRERHWVSLRDQQLDGDRHEDHMQSAPRFQTTWMRSSSALGAFLVPMMTPTTQSERPGSIQVFAAPYMDIWICSYSIKFVSHALHPGYPGKFALAVARALFVQSERELRAFGPKLRGALIAHGLRYRHLQNRTCAS